ncbi:methionine synthase [Arthrobacter sp. Hiyo4]|nr:methionine synthase [Arthrobacter sp. Hiyo4]
MSFGLNPAARVVLNSVFLHEAVQAGLTSGIIDAAKIVPLASLPEEQRKVALDLVWDKREYDAEGNTTYDPLAIMLDMFAGVDTAALKDQRAAELAALPTGARLERRIIDGEGKGLEEDLDLARSEGMTPLGIINDHLLEGMKVVGERFGAGEMQLPFVLQSAEVMKNAVALLEPHMEKSDSSGKGTMVIATVRGDVHDIGKNLVDIILTNNGYKVVNIGIKQGIAEIIAAAEQHNADVIGMSGLLVKSTVVMKENLAELQSRGLAKKWPVILGGAALTRAYVEQDLAEQFDGVVRYAKDAFEGLALMEPLVRVARGESPDDVGLPPLKKRIHKGGPKFTVTEPEAMPGRSDVATDNHVPAPPFWGTRIVRGVSLHDYSAFLDERATFMGQWGLKPGRGEDGASYEELVEREGRPACATGWTASSARACSTRPWPTATSRWFPRGSRWWCCTTARIPTASWAPRPARPGWWNRCPDRHRTAAFRFPAPAPRPAPVPGGLCEVARIRPDRRAAGAAGDRRFEDRRVHLQDVRRQPVPRLLRAQRPGHAAHRGAGRVLARPDPLRAGVRGRGAQRQGRAVQAGLPRCAVLARLPCVPGHGGPPEGDGATEARTDGCDPERRADAASRAVH